VRVRHQPKSRFPVAQEPRDFLLQRIRIADLHRGFIHYQCLSEGGEIFHVWTEEHWFAGENGLDWILSAARRQTFADKYYRGDGIPMLQFARGIEKDALGRRRGGAAGLTAQGNFQAKTLEASANFGNAFHMSGRDNQSECREVGMKPLKDFTEDFLFARVRASAEENGTIAVDAEPGQNLKRQIGIQSHVSGIVFNTADVLNAIARHAEPDPALNVIRFLDADSIETTKSRRDQDKETAETRFGSFRKTRVNERQRDASSLRFRGEIRPDFSFHEDDADGANHGESAPDDWPKIERIVEDLHPVTGFGIRNLEARRGCCRQDAEKIWIELAQFRGQFQRDCNFADADRVDPGIAMRGEARADVGPVNAKALSQFVPVISAPKQLRDLARKKEEQADRIKKIVEEPDHQLVPVSPAAPFACRNKTSVAP